MSLQSLLAINQQKGKKQGISEQRLQENLPQIRKLISFFKWYPDLFVDFIKGPDSTFKFLFLSSFPKLSESSNGIAGAEVLP